ncbi:N-succinylarginine dihydrolase [Legionella dresdenensis]|uniref:N-succinylarginine dihydrolase n=1 Tax=Legionella dresdenensis TaxID=450200 RepID=A0ABV8CGY1_9GAMM
MKVTELNIDGLVGPTHHYAGLSAGNIASTSNAHTRSNPQAAALQGIAKMRMLHKLGIPQALFPPHQRPNLELLHQCGFSGSPEQQITKAHKQAPEILSACYSASSMWTANAATVSASNDTSNNRVHFTAANLVSNLHRHQEAGFSRKLLQTIFSNPEYFQHHPVLPGSVSTGDEGAANHTRLCKSHSASGLNLFVYGKHALHSRNDDPMPVKYPARQTYEASAIVARAHELDPAKVIFACQNSQAIDLGVFHNDVIAVGNENVLLIHEHAFQHQLHVLAELRKKSDFELSIIEIRNEQLTVEQAVRTYLFNSQLVTLPDQSMALIAPTECKNDPQVKYLIDSIISDKNNPVNLVHYLDLKQSMRNGGGPACLRLRVPLNQAELKAMHQGVLVNDDLLAQLEQWVLRHYRHELHANDLADPALITEVLTALDSLTQLLKLGSVYPFQQEN